jgi:ketosteroid isomerase-like protein
MAGQTNEDVAATIVALEKGALDRWGRGDPMGFVEIAAPQITYFDPDLERRIDGIEAFSELMEGIKGKIFMDGYELLNPTVEIADELAVLSFNYTSWGESDGGSWRSNWNSSEVYRKINGAWRIVHSHWSRTQPESAGAGP